MSVTTTVFMNGGSQAVRIPKGFRFDTAEVSVQPYGDGILLMPIRRKVQLSDLFQQCDALSEDDKSFLENRTCNSIPAESALFK